MMRCGLGVGLLLFAMCLLCCRYDFCAFGGVVFLLICFLILF